MPTEDPTLPEHIATADAQARASLIRAESCAALAALGCSAPEKFSPLIEDRLRAILVSADVGLRVFAVDAKGEIRTGPRGPEVAADVVARLRDEIPEIFHSHKTFKST